MEMQTENTEHQNAEEQPGYGQESFQIFYNHTIYPELVRMEGERVNLLRLLLLSVFIFLGLFGFGFFIGIWVISITLMIPAGVYMSYLVFRIQKFRQRFKPHVVKLILDYIDNKPNYGEMSYDSKGKISKATFKKSLMFSSPAHYYVGEDLIKGRVGDLRFEMSELNVREMSKTRNRLQYVFRGVFLHASESKDIEGRVVLLPSEFRQYLTRTLKSLHLSDCLPVEGFALDDRLESYFMTYATTEAPIRDLLSKDMQAAIFDYREATDKEIYISFINSEIYIAVTEDRNLLEPGLLTSNLSYDLVREFYEDISLLLRVIEDFNMHH